MNKLACLLFWVACGHGLSSTAGGEGREASPAVVNPPCSSLWRSTVSLDGGWDFATDPQREGDRQEWFRAEVPLPGRGVVQVPGSWEAQGIGGPGHSVSVTPEQRNRPLRGSYVGTAWYRKEVVLPRAWVGRQLWLKVGGVHAQGWFYVNGVFLGHNASYCGTYKYNITDLVKPDGKVVVAVKVRNDVPSGKGLYGWIHRFGGLYRSVEIDATAPWLVDYAYVEGDLDQRQGTAHLTLRSTGSDPQEVEATVTVTTLGGERAGQATARCRLEGGQTRELALPVPLDPLEPWSPEHPNLYRADIVLRVGGQAVDGWVERFGVRKWEVRGGSFYLNNRKHFVRGFGDDWVYPLTICSPASREFHREHFRLAKAFGFGYVRHHTHCELPEFFDAADELGIMVQPELPYYGATPSAADPAWFRPKEDLVELIAHYRRHVSLSTYCTGNEGHLGSPLDQEIYRLGKRLDPTRLFLHQDGGHNTPENSDFRTGPVDRWEAGVLDDSRPFFAHEYLNLAVDADPRLASRYTGAQLPPFPLEPFQEALANVGLPLAWGYACLDAGRQLQRLHQKRGLESARLDPVCDGYIYWTLMDVGYFGDQGLLTQFWDVKASRPEFFRQFNGPTALLVKVSPGERIAAAGDTLTMDWWISPFDSAPIEGATLAWRLVARGQTLAAGRLSGLNVQPGNVRSVGRAEARVPALEGAVRAELQAALEGTGVRNTWDVWLFPAVPTDAEAGKGLAATDEVYETLRSRYPGLARFGSAEAASAEVLLASSLSQPVAEWLERGNKAMLLKLEGPNPGVGLGWWGLGPQTGTAIARHAAFGDFPHDGYLDEGWFRLVGNTLRLSDGGYEGVEPLMVGHGSLGYLVHVFEARADRGRLLGSGLNLLSGKPEANYLLDRFVRYVRSEQFHPRGTFDLAREKARVEEMARFRRDMNGWSRTVETKHTVSYASFLGPLNMSVVRLSGPQDVLRWETVTVPADLGGEPRYTLQWVAGMGYRSQPQGTFRLFLGERHLVDFEVTSATTTWKDPDGVVELHYDVRQTSTEDASGVMRLTLPAAWLTPGQKAELRVVPVPSNSLRWVSVYEY